MFTNIAFAAPSTPDADVLIISHKDGNVVSSPLEVKFGVAGMEIVPAGIGKEHSGHHH